MPLISITPVNSFKLEIDVSEIPDLGMKWEFLTIVDELTLAYVLPNEFWDSSRLEPHYQERIEINHPIEGGQVADFICKINAEFEKFKASNF